MPTPAQALVDLLGRDVKAGVVGDVGDEDEDVPLQRRLLLLLGDAGDARRRSQAACDRSMVRLGLGLGARARATARATARAGARAGLGLGLGLGLG